MLERETKTLFSRDQRDIQMIRASIYATNQKEEGSTRQITANLIGGRFRQCERKTDSGGWIERERDGGDTELLKGGRRRREVEHVRVSGRSLGFPSSSPKFTHFFYNKKTIEKKGYFLVQQSCERRIES